MPGDLLRNLNSIFAVKKYIMFVVERGDFISTRNSGWQSRTSAIRLFTNDPNWPDNKDSSANEESGESKLKNMDITLNQIHILRHSLGLDDKGHGNQYRNYYCTGYDCDGFKEVMDLAVRGLMEFGRRDDRNLFYFVTDAGKKEALKDVVYPVLTRSQKRYQRFRDADYGASFKEWLMWQKNLPQHERA